MRFLDRAFAAVVIALALLNGVAQGQGLPNGGQSMAPVGQAWQGSSSLAPNGTVYDLVRDFEAKCDGSTDDTTALQNWLNAAAAGVILTAPAGTCEFSEPLTVGAASKYTIEGAGSSTTTLLYTGGATAATATASGTWTTSSSSLTLSANAPAWITTELAYAPVAVWDTQPTTGPELLGFVSSAPSSGTTVTLTGNAAFASTGSSDTLKFTVNLLTINAPMSGSVAGITIRDLRMRSSNALTGGYAIGANGMFTSTIDHLILDGGGSEANHYLCGGVWFNGAAGIDLLAPFFNSQQNCADGVLINSATLGGSTSNAEVRIFGGSIGGSVASGVISGFTNGVHVAGGFGGFRGYGTNDHNNLIGTLIDEAVTATGNRDVEIHYANDSNQNAGIQVNDSGSSGLNLDLDDWVASTQTGHGIVITSMPSGIINLRGSVLYNNCGSGFYSADTTSYVMLSGGVAAYNNGGTLSSACTTWQAANTGHGYGFENASLTTKMLGVVAPWGNSAGTFKNSIGINLMAGNSIATGQYLSRGSTPTNSGTCAINTQGGGSTEGKFSMNGACSAAGTVILAISSYQATGGWTCDTHDLTTPADNLNETATTTSTITFTTSTGLASGDVIRFKCTGD